MNKKQKDKVVELRKKGLGYTRIANRINKINRDQVRYFIKSDWFRENQPELIKVNNFVSIKKLEKRIEYFKNKFEKKFPEFKYHSGYTGTDDYFKMECRKCGHIQERNAQCARPSRNKELSCDKCELRERVANRILSVKQKIIRKKKYKIKIEKQKEFTRKINNEIKAIKQIKKNHRYYKKCNECGKNFFTNRMDVKTCNDKCKTKRRNRIKDLNRRRRLRENGKINYKITINKLAKRSDGICQICGKPVNFDDFYRDGNGNFIAGPKYPSIDHIIPVAKGGTHTIDNVQLAHRDCNYNKSDESIFEFEENKLKISI